MDEDAEKQKRSNRLVRNLAVALIAVIVIAIGLLISYSLTTDTLRATLGYAAIVFLPIIIILAYALAIAVLHKRQPRSSSPTI